MASLEVILNLIDNLSPAIDSAASSVDAINDASSSAEDGLSQIDDMTIKNTAAAVDDFAQERASKLEKMINNMDYPFRKVRNDIYSALIYGYSISEIIWDVNNDNEYVFSRIRPIPIETIPDPFVYNEEGDLTAIIQIDPDTREEIEIDAEKCLIYTYDETFGDKKGCSILDAIYDNWFQKQLLLQYWHTYLQKHEGPTLAAFINDPMWNTQVEDMLGSVHEGRANLVLGKDDRIETVESNHRGEGFKDAITYHEIMIFRKMNIGTLLLGQQETAGAYSQSETQFDILKIFLDGIHADIAAELQRVVNAWYGYQYPALVDVPQIHFESFEEKDISELLTTLKPFIDNMTIDPSSSWFKQIIGDLVSNYSDIDMSSYLENDETSELKKEDDLTPSLEDINTPVDKKSMENIKEILSV